MVYISLMLIKPTYLNLDCQTAFDHLCDTCNKAKQTREPFPLSDHKSSKIGRVSSKDDGTELSPNVNQGNDNTELSLNVNQGNDNSGATSMDETNNTHPEGIVPNETHFINEFDEHSKLNFDVKELPANTDRRKYYLELLKDYGLLGCKPVSTLMVPNSVLPYERTEDDPLLDNIIGYQKLIGKLIYLTHTRPDIAYSVHCLAQYMHSPLKSHLSYALNVLRYLKGAPSKGIRYKYPDIKDTICGYSDQIRLNA
nr:ribonuclease H-like domain-containing protein [Tanacetum cinerariifolium]